MTCAIAFAKTKEGKDHAKKERGKELLRRKRNLRQNNRSWWVKRAQEAFNKYVRTRDADLPCISCGITTGQMHCGHYITVGHGGNALRFDPRNAHKQCAQCNNFKSGNLKAYRPPLIEKIGMEEVEWLEGHHDPVKFSIDDLREIRDRFKQLTKELESAAQVA